MLCQNCNKYDASVRYTEIINGEKKEMFLCEKCSKKLGIDNMDFNMPINFSSFLGDFLGDYEDEIIPMLVKPKELKCSNCNMTYEEFTSSGRIGCSKCYEQFSDKLSSLLKRIHGSDKYMGRKLRATKEKGSIRDSSVEEKKQINVKKENKTEKLQVDLKKAIVEERYEDAAKIRDEIKKIDKQ